MTRPQPLPPALGSVFTVGEAAASGVSKSRLRAGDLAIPFRGVRTTAAASDAPLLRTGDDYAIQAAIWRKRAIEYARRMHPDHHLSHESAVALFGGPLPLHRDFDGELELDLPVHVSAFRSGTVPRMHGVVGHRANRTSQVVVFDGVRVSSPACTWASMGRLSVSNLVALGDYFCRVWRPGYNRPDVGRPPLATREQLRAALRAGRRVGAKRLRAALEFIREDSWSPRESIVRYHLVASGLPEPELNLDVFDDFGRFIGCVDLAYPELKIAIEYHGVQHSATYAQDVERIARLRAAGWIVIEVTSALLRDPEELVRRVAAALASAR